jgi:hypothetical protein
LGEFSQQRCLAPAGAASDKDDLALPGQGSIQEALQLGQFSLASDKDWWPIGFLLGVEEDRGRCSLWSRGSQANRFLSSLKLEELLNLGKLLAL